MLSTDHKKHRHDLGVPYQPTKTFYDKSKAYDG